MPLKEDILKKYALKYHIPFELVFRVFEEERANTKANKPAVEFRRESIETIVEKWVDGKMKE